MLIIDGQLKFSEYSNLYDIVVPQNHILRKISEEIDFSFVNPMLEQSYSKKFGRPAKEPEMMFKILFLKRMHDLSDRALVNDLGYNMAFKYFIGLAPEDTTIDSSLLTKFRKTRITEDMLEEMLTETIRQAIEKNLIKSNAIIVDATHSSSKGNPETPTQILRRLTKTLRREVYKAQPELAEIFPEKPIETSELEEELEYTKQLVELLSDKLMSKDAIKKLENIKELLENDKIKAIKSEKDKEASFGYKTTEDCFFGYKSHLAITEDRLITAVEVTTGNESDTNQLHRLINISEKNGVDVKEVIGDKAYNSKKNIEYCNSKDIKLISRLNKLVDSFNDKKDGWIFNKDAGMLRCPEGHLATSCKKAKTVSGSTSYQYHFSMKVCKKCSLYNECCKNKPIRKIKTITLREGTLAEHQTFEASEYFVERIKERYKIEAKNAELKQAHGLARCKYTGLFGMKIQMYVSAFVVNIKRIIRLKEIEMA